METLTPQYLAERRLEVNRLLEDCSNDRVRLALGEDLRARGWQIYDYFGCEQYGERMPESGSVYPLVALKRFGQLNLAINFAGSFNGPVITRPEQGCPIGVLMALNNAMDEVETAAIEVKAQKLWEDAGAVYATA